MVHQLLRSLLVASCCLVVRATFADDYLNVGYVPSPAQKVNVQSTRLMSRPYLNHPLSDIRAGHHAERDRMRWDGFDCQTYVETSLAAAHAKHWYDTGRDLDRLRHGGLQPNYYNRLHFVSWQWNPAMHRLGVLRDITPELAAPGVPVQTLQIGMTPRRWLVRQSMTPDIFGMESDFMRYLMGLTLLNRHAEWPEIVKVKLTVIPTRALLDVSGQVNWMWAQQLPPISVFEWVNDQAGHGRYSPTPMLVTHMGFLVRRGDQIWLRHASSRFHRVIEEPLNTYLQRRGTDHTYLHIEGLPQ